MKVKVAVLADCANIAPQSKLNLMGVFDTIYTQGLPAIHPFMMLVLRLQLDYEDGGKSHRLEISFRDADGHEMARADSISEIRPIPAGEIRVVDHLLAFAGLAIERPGQYCFQVRWNEVVIEEVALRVVLTTPAARVF